MNVGDANVLTCELSDNRSESHKLVQNSTMSFIGSFYFK